MSEFLVDSNISQRWECTWFHWYTNNNNNIVCSVFCKLFIDRSVSKYGDILCWVNRSFSQNFLLDQPSRRYTTTCYQCSTAMHTSHYLNNDIKCIGDNIACFWVKITVHDKLYYIQLVSSFRGIGERVSSSGDIHLIRTLTR